MFPQILPFAITCVKKGGLPESGFLNFSFFGATPLMRTVAVSLIVDPFIVTTNAPAAVRSRRQEATDAIGGGGVGHPGVPGTQGVTVSQVNVTWTPCWLPRNP